MRDSSIHYTYIECMCSYFDTLALSDDGYEEALRLGLVSNEESNAVGEFHALAKTHQSPTNDWDHAAILNDPKWQAVVAAAKRAQSELLRMLENDEERSALTEE